MRKGLKEEKEKCLGTACFRTWLKTCIIEMAFRKMHWCDAMINSNTWAYDGRRNI